MAPCRPCRLIDYTIGTELGPGTLLLDLNELGMRKIAASEGPGRPSIGGWVKARTTTHFGSFPPRLTGTFDNMVNIESESRLRP